MVNHVSLEKYVTEEPNLNAKYFLCATSSCIWHKIILESNILTDWLAKPDLTVSRQTGWWDPSETREGICRRPWSAAERQQIRSSARWHVQMVWCHRIWRRWHQTHRRIHRVPFRADLPALSVNGKNNLFLLANTFTMVTLKHTDTRTTCQNAGLHTQV